MIHRGRRWIMRFDLSDDEWALLEPLMPKSRMSARVDDRKIMNAIFYVLRTGMPWRDLPERYGPYTTAYNRFNRWSRRGIWKRIFDTLASKSRDSLYLIDRRSLHENPRHCRQQRPPPELHGDGRAGPRQSGRWRHTRHSQAATGHHRRQGLRQRESAPADQG